MQVVGGEFDGLVFTVPTEYADRTSFEISLENKKVLYVQESRTDSEAVVKEQR